MGLLGLLLGIVADRSSRNNWSNWIVLLGVMVMIIVMIIVMVMIMVIVIVIITMKILVLKISMIPIHHQLYRTTLQLPLTPLTPTNTASDTAKSY